MFLSDNETKVKRMDISFSFYTKKNGDVIVYANGGNGCSIAIDGGGAPAPYGKTTTKGQRNLIECLSSALGNAPSVPDVPFDETNFLGRKLMTPYGLLVEAIGDNGRDEGQKVVLLKSTAGWRALPFGRYFSDSSKFFNKGA